MKKTALVLLLPVLLAACSLFGDDENRADLERNRRLWERQGIDSYTYTLNIGCFCPYLGPTRVLVHADTVFTVEVTVPIEDLAPTAEQLQFYARTVDDLFDVIDDALRQGADDLQVTYDPALGYPTRISIDYEKNAVDDEVVYQAEGLIPLREDG